MQALQAQQEKKEESREKVEKIELKLLFEEARLWRLLFHEGSICPLSLQLAQEQLTEECLDFMLELTVFPLCSSGDPPCKPSWPLHQKHQVLPASSEFFRAVWEQPWALTGCLTLLCLICWILGEAQIAQGQALQACLQSLQLWIKFSSWTS